MRRPGKVDTDRNAKRPPFVCVLVWVYFVHERFESGFRDLTLCVKVLRKHLPTQGVSPQEDRTDKIQAVVL